MPYRLGSEPFSTPTVLPDPRTSNDLMSVRRSYQGGAGVDPEISDSIYPVVPLSGHTCSTPSPFGSESSVMRHQAPLVCDPLRCQPFTEK